MKMISFTYLTVFAFCLTYAATAEEGQQTGTTPAPEDVASRELTDTGYVIRYGGESYRYPVRIVPLIRRIQPQQQNPTETNEIENEEDEKRRPLFYFTTYEAPEGSSPPQGLPTSRPYIEIRRKRDVNDSEIPESSKIGKLRRKRTYCRKCGGGGYGGYGGGYIPVSYAVYPVYYGGGGGGRGCNTCGGYGGGGGGGGSFSYSSSSAHSSSGSFGWGRK